MSEALFMVCGLLATVFAVLTVTLRSPLRCAMALLVHVLSLAGLYLSLSAHLLAALQVIVYAGAVVVLFVFVIMLIGPSALESKPSSEGLVSGAIAAAFGILLTGSIAFSVSHVAGELIPTCGEVETGLCITEICADGGNACPEVFGGVAAISQAIFVNAAVPFEMLSILLLVAIIAAIAIARGKTIESAHHAEEIATRRLSPRPFPNDEAPPVLNPIRPTSPAILDAESAGNGPASSTSE